MSKGNAGYRRASVAVAVFCAGLIALVWAATAQRATFEREEAIEAQLQANANLAIALEQHMVRTLQAAEQLADFVRHQYRLLGADASLQRYVARAAERDEGINIISVVNERGTIVLSSQPTGEVNYRDREFFVEQQRAPGGLYVSRPVLGRVSHTWQIPMSLRIERAGGAFGGVIVLSVSPEYFTALGEGPGRLGAMSIIGHDGIARARRVGSAVGHGQELGPQAAFVDAAARAGTLVGVDASDGVRRLSAYRRLDDYPLTVVVGTAEEEALAPVLERREAYYVAALLASLLIGGFGLVLIRYIGSRAHLEVRLAHQAQHDPLTRLPNRALLHDRLAQQIVQARRRERVAALLFIDLDRFKAVNDNFGHACGDAVLRETAARMKRGLRETDTVARYGGDEFAVVAGDLAGAHEAERIAAKMLAELRRPMRVEGREVAISASIGIACFPADGADADTLLRRADQGALRAKRSGRDNVQSVDGDLPA